MYFANPFLPTSLWFLFYNGWQEAVLKIFFGTYTFILFLQMTRIKIFNELSQ